MSDSPRTITIKMGNSNCPDILTVTEGMTTCRTQKQITALIDYVLAHPEVVFFSTPTSFLEQDKPGQQYNCTFRMCYYDRDGRMNVFKITPTGQIKDYTKLDHPDMTKYKMVNKTLAEHRELMQPTIDFNHTHNVTNY
jgi:hypothetical protein